MGLLSCSVVTGPAFGPEANALQDAAMHHQISQWLHGAFNDKPPTATWSRHNRLHVSTMSILNVEESCAKFLSST